MACQVPPVTLPENDALAPVSVRAVVPAGASTTDFPDGVPKVSWPLPLSVSVAVPAKVRMFPGALTDAPVTLKAPVPLPVRIALEVADERPVPPYETEMFCPFHTQEDINVLLETFCAATSKINVPFADGNV